MNVRSTDQALKILRDRRRLIEQQMKRLREDIEAINRAEDILSEPYEQPSFLNERSSGSGELAGLTPTKAILKVLDDRPEKLWRAAELAKDLKSRGYKSGSKHFASVVSATLVRLASQDKIERIREEGRAWRYKKKKENEKTEG
jgi:hypothetical protein